MLHRKLSAVVVSVLLSLVAYIAATKTFLYADTGFLEFPKTALGSYTAIVQFSTNSYYSWRFEPITHFLFGSHSFLAYFSSQIFLFALFLSLLLGTLCQTREMLNMAISGVLTLVLFYWFALDLAVWSFLVALVVELFFYHYAKERCDQPWKKIGVVVIATGFAFGCANSLGILATLIAVLLVSPGLSGVVGTIVVILLSFTISSPDFPLYKTTGHLVPDYGVVDGLQPLLGDKPRLLHINREALREAYRLPGIALFLFSLLAAGVLRFGHKEGKAQNIQLFWVGGMLLAAFVVLDSGMVSADFSQISPLQSLARICPNLFYIALTPMAYSAGLVLLALALSEDISGVFLLGAFCSLSVLLAPVSARFEDEKLWNSINNVGDENTREQIYHALNSPSYWLIRHYGIDLFQHFKQQKDISFESMDELSPKVLSSSHMEDLKFLSDGKDTSAWSSGGGRQLGDEWLRFIFPVSEPIAGIRLETGRYFTDFPRGIEIRVASECDENGESENYSVIFHEPHAQGEILFTEDGIPFFSQQYTFSTTFSPQRIRCLWVRQIGQESHFDWSVSETYFAKVVQMTRENAGP